ncbi:helix-turn-helix domain-containing protein [Streptomyces sp. DH8]|uniref:helix-turn-helix domain-containing protein n=1 Tax=Streptomyces sp. DH8 TaxID=2857008 RepID=UPI001E56D50B|nr:DUF559 domain-containing protein [Streptomyces sp. DH8]
MDPTHGERVIEELKLSVRFAMFCPHSIVQGRVVNDEAICRVPTPCCREVVHVAVPRNDLDIDYLIERYQAGASTRELGSEFGVSHATVKARLVKAGVEIRSTGAARKAVVKLRHLVPDVLGRFDRGEQTAEIARATGVSRAGITSILMDNGRDPDGNVPLPLNVDEVIRRYKSGESASEIAMAMNTSSMTVKRRLVAAGVTLRTVAEASRLSFARDPGRLAQARAAQALGVAARRRDDLPAKSIAEAYEAGTSLASLATTYECSPAVIERVLRTFGTMIRDLSSAGRVRAASEDPEAKALRLAKMSATTRGRPLPRETAEKVAVSKHRKLTQNMGVDEEDVFRALADAGLEALRQTPVGRYNLDFSVGQVAIEVHAGRHGPHLNRHRRHDRVDYLTDLGWRVLYLWCPDGLNACDLEEAVSLTERLGGEPPTRGQYLVLRCKGDPPPSRTIKPNYGSRVATTGSRHDARCRNGSAG